MLIYIKKLLNKTTVQSVAAVYLDCGLMQLLMWVVVTPGRGNQQPSEVSCTL